MTRRSPPPRLVVKTLLATFGTGSVVLLLVFVLVRMNVRDQVRQTVTQNLEITQAMLAAIEEQRLQELRAQATSLAENPTLKAAVDTYAAETSFGDISSRAQLVRTMQRELDKVAAQIETDAVTLRDVEGTVLASSGRFAVLWRPSPNAGAAPASPRADAHGIVRAGGILFRTTAVPLTLDDGAVVGHLEVGSALDLAYARTLDRLSRTRAVILHDDTLVATTLPPQAAERFRAAVAAAPPASGTVELDGALHAYREIARLGTARIYALGSVDEASRAALAQVNRTITGLVVGSFALALLASVWLARQLTRPVERLSASLARMTAAGDLSTPLRSDGSSRELDMLTTTFNQLMASVVDAELRTEAAYAAAIRALAAALDARDPYTAGHSERVSVLSVEIGRVIQLPESELEVLRLGALLHDIGKIGIPDEILRKPSALTRAEFEAIREHPVVGARILRTVPFLLPHLDIVELHHERPDGLGYPRGLRGDDIPLLARIVHVADAYDAITSARAYRAGRSSADALRELWRCAGTEYHAEIVDALARALPELMVAESPVPVEALSA
jgi:putative nucleotidyltransferase with HDIG domain